MNDPVELVRGAKMATVLDLIDIVVKVTQIEALMRVDEPLGSGYWCKEVAEQANLVAVMALKRVQDLLKEFVEKSDGSITA